MWAIVGPTASAKSESAMHVALATGAEIVSVDSMQVYRGMDIGTAKPTPEDREAVPHHLVDIADAAVEFSVAEFQSAGREVLADLAQRDVPALIAGGSGLHFRALVDPMDFPSTDPAVRAELENLEPAEARQRLESVDPAVAEVVDMDNPRRVVRALEVYEVTGETPSMRAATPRAEAVRSYRPIGPIRVIGLDPGEALRGRVESRCQAMVEAGLVDEVAALKARLGLTARQAVGYREMLGVLEGESTPEAAMASMVQATLAVAKNQRTFFRKDPRVQWLPWSDDGATRSESVAKALAEEQAWIS
ncbi:MAG: tRNA (adenosine(37)-N6)-dimethylallyltransferase MiaA [Acidimicrobiia bacterium]|nr:tRNA (adenosine(37)-N6)-dimethylallyltransferase MiaA [Acidimicrobiia bacterium]